MKVKVLGVEELQAKISKLSNTNVAKGLLKGSLRVERDAKILVPVDTGLLRNSITHSISGDVATIGTSIEYGPDVELGINQRAQPFLTPALNMNRAQIRQDIIEAMNTELRKVAK